MGWKFLAIGVFTLAASGQPPAQLRPRKITETSARELVQQALLALGEKKGSVEIAPLPYPWAPEFYTLQAWRGPNQAGPDGVGVLQTHSFAVNPWTGDVWDLIACTRISSPQLQKEQKAMRKRSRFSSGSWKTLRNKSPGNCSAEAP